MLIWILIVYGVTLAITGSQLTRPFREALCQKWPAAGRFVSCSMCVGWWTGLALWIVAPELCPVHAVHREVSGFSNAFASLAACWAIHVVLARLGAEEM